MNARFSAVGESPAELDATLNRMAVLCQQRSAQIAAGGRPVDKLVLRLCDALGF